MRWAGEIAGDDVFDLRHGGRFRIDVVGDDLSASHHHDTVDHLKHMMDVVGDEDAGMAGIAGVADEAEDSLWSYRRDEGRTSMWEGQDACMRRAVVVERLASTGRTRVG